MQQKPPLLNVFLTLVEEKSFTRAAEKLGRTQPAVTQAIQRLEAELGEPLLDRSGRELALTEAGRVVFEAARRQENLQRELSTRLAELRNKDAGRLVVGANESMILYLLPHLIRYRQAYPKVKLVVQRSRSSEMTELLLAGDVDFGVVSYLTGDERFHSEVLYVDHLSCVVAPDHRLAQKKMLFIRDLGAETFVAHNVASPYRDAVMKAFQQQNIQLNMDIEMPTVESIRRMVQSGLGVAFLPRVCVDQDLRTGILKEIPVSELQLERKIYLVSVDKRPLSHAAGAFQELLKSELAG
ncbi:MAG: LysR family transcriptional regulator [Acidobacteriota bacterium]|nr:LysR family transcriptional regulator [Acidobacteriota bacterium]